jgi:acyl-coenzyme A thioesterase PaaI-like protein
LEAKKEHEMGEQGVLPPLIAEIIQQRLGDRMDQYLIPPPVFVAMQGEFLAFDPEGGTLETRFPVLREHLNPYGTMQGGMVAAAVDNTLGPLSMLLAPPNVTRRLQMKYSRPATPDLEYIQVKGRLLERKGRRLTFSAEVRDQEGLLLARARAEHWIVDEHG